MANIRAIKTSNCSVCGAKIWTAWDANVLASRAVVDAEVFLNNAGECAAIIGDRQTWDFSNDHIHQRYKEIRLKKRAGIKDNFGIPCLVVVEHKHWRPVPGKFRFFPESRETLSLPTQPPF
jgi:hypothetical protein